MNVSFLQAVFYSTGEKIVYQHFQCLFENGLFCLCSVRKQLDDAQVNYDVPFKKEILYLISLSHLN